MAPADGGRKLGCGRILFDNPAEPNLSPGEGMGDAADGGLLKLTCRTSAELHIRAGVAGIDLSRRDAASRRRRRLSGYPTHTTPVSRKKVAKSCLHIDHARPPTAAIWLVHEAFGGRPA
jgi:hypothetical protein